MKQRCKVKDSDGNLNADPSAVLLSTNLKSVCYTFK